MKIKPMEWNEIEITHKNELVKVKVIGGKLYSSHEGGDNDSTKEKDEYYNGMFGSLKHNILLMLNQIDGNAEYSDVDIMSYLEVIESRIRDIKIKYYKSKENEK